MYIPYGTLQALQQQRVQEFGRGAEKRRVHHDVVEKRDVSLLRRLTRRTKR
jgi:hypothetical protein